MTWSSSLTAAPIASSIQAAICGMCSSRSPRVVIAGVPDEVAAGALIAWSGLFGLVSFELFGQFENVVTDRAAFFDHAAACLGRLAGLPA